LDVDIDCSVADSDWFELKAYVTDDVSGSGAWERDVTQAGACLGEVGGARPYASANHVARCGFVNAFVFEQGSCTIDSL